MNINVIWENLKFLKKSLTYSGIAIPKCVIFAFIPPG